MVDFSGYRGKRVLVTGDTGFKGAWLSLWLHQLGADVTGLSLPPDGEMPLYEAAGINEIIHHADGDIRNLDIVRTIFQEARPEYVFHLAAQSLVRRSYKEPVTTFETNVVGTINILEAIRETDTVQAVVIVTTDKCYKNREWDRGYREDDELGGVDPYSASKAAAEIAFASYNDCFLKNRPGLGCATARAGNVIGGGDWAEDRIIPDCIRAVTSEEAIRVRNPDATRPWQHVLDPLSGYLLLAACLAENPQAYTGAWNFGPPMEAVLTVGDLVDQVVQCWGSGDVIVDQDPEAPHEANQLQLNTEKAQSELKWQPKWDAAKSIAEAVDWYKAVQQGQNARDATLAQINRYMGE